MPRSKPFKYLKKQLSLIEKQQEAIEDDWIHDYYQNGFEVINGSRKNAGENSILVLAVLIALFLQNRLLQVTICSDVEVRDIKQHILDYILASEYSYPKREKITFLSTDAILKNAWLNGNIQLTDIAVIRTNQRRIIGYLTKGDHTSEQVNRVVATDEFIDFLQEGLIIYF